MLNVAILGTGNLGTDLLIKICRSLHLRCTAFVGRNFDSKGLLLAKSKGICTSYEGIAFLQKNAGCFDLVFDVTNACSHLKHWPILEAMGKKVIDLTPSHIGHMIVPTINLHDVFKYDNLGLISCGGQASLPVIHTIASRCRAIHSIEVVSSIASKSAGPGTRINIDEYICKTESAIQFFSGCPNVKSILILNPATPEINMKTSIYVEAEGFELSDLGERLLLLESAIQKSIPGYRIIVGPIVDAGILIVSVQVIGSADFLPSYAGNLDIINCAAVQIAEALAASESIVCC